MKKLIVMTGLVALSAAALAKLPAPVLDDAAKAKADEAKAKTAHGGKVDAYKLCLAMDRSAANYFKTAAAAGKSVKPAQAAPACADPGPFVWPLPAAAATPAAVPTAAPAAAPKKS
jgi:hypothetical protein